MSVFLFLHPTKPQIKWYQNQSKKYCQVQKILKGSLDSIPSASPSVKIQIMCWKVCLRCKGKTLLGVVNKLLKTKILLTSPSNVLPYQLNTMRTNLPKTLDQLIFGKYILNLSKVTKYLVNGLKFTKYLVNSYHQKDVKHYVLTN